MACDVKITLNNGTSLTFKDFIDLSDSPILEIAKALFNDNKNRLKLADAFTNFYSGSSIGESQIGNISYLKLTEQVPIRGGWPEYDLESKGTYILYIDLNRGFSLPKPYRIRVNEEGLPDKFITVQPVYKSSIYAFRNHLIATQLVESLDKSVKFSPEFEELTKGKSLEEIKNILKTYLEEGTYSEVETFKYKGKTLDTNTVLEDEILGLSGRIRNRVYKDEFLNYLNTNLQSVLGSYGKYEIQFANLVQKAKTLILDKKLTDLVSALETLQNSEEEGTPKKIVDICSEIIKTLKEKDPEFPYNVSIIRGGKLQFNLISRTINEKYPGITYGKIQDDYLFKEDYRGFDIYLKLNDGRFYVTKGPVTNDSKVIPYSTIEDARKAVDYNINGSKLTLSYYLNRRLKDGSVGTRTYLTSTMKFEEGQIIKSLDYVLPTKTINGELATLLNNKTYKDFVNYINTKATYNEVLKQQILEAANTPEKAAIFIYSVAGNEDDISRVQQIIHALELSNGYKYFYVLQGDTPFNLRVKEITEDSFKTLKDTYKAAPKLSSHDIPTAEFIHSLVTAILNKLEGTGFTVELLTSEEIKKNYPKSDNKAKAFISGNTLVINASTADILTPLHEYAHIFLGLLKARNFTKYRQLIDNALSNYRNQDILAKLRHKKEELYPDYSEYDIDEELFADMFSRYIIDNSDFTQVDNEVKKEVLESLDMLNEFSKRLNLANLWLQPISIFSNYNSDVMIELNDNDDRNVHKVYRQAANWIRDNINKKKIKEVCK